MINLNEICKNHATILSNGYALVSLSGFAEACYNDNSLSELIEALDGEASHADCVNWGISTGEWRDSVEMAVAAIAIEENDDKIPS